MQADGVMQWFSATASSLLEVGFPEGVPLQRTPIWAAMGMTLTLYNIITIPYRAVFFRGDNEYTLSSAHSVFIFLDYLADLFFWIELGLLVSATCFKGQVAAKPTMGSMSRVQTVRQMSMKRGALAYNGNAMSASSSAVADSSIETVDDEYDSDSDSDGDDDIDDEDELKLQQSRAAMVVRIQLYLELAFYFVSGFPTDLFAAAAGTTNIIIFRAPRLLQYIPLYWRTETVLSAAKGLSMGAKRIVIYYVMFFILVHFVGCGFFALSAEEIKFHDETWTTADMLLQPLSPSGAATHVQENLNITTNLTTNTTTTVGWEHPGFFYQYMRSAYWACITMVTVGFGDIVPVTINETIYTVFTMYIGVVFTCAFIGNLTNLVANLDAAEAEFQMKMDNLNKYMEYRNLPSDVRRRIRDYKNYMWSCLRGIDEKRLLAELPSSLKTRVTGLVSGDFIKRVPFLRKCKASTLNAIYSALEKDIFSPGDFLAKQKQPATGASFISRGEAEKLDRAGLQVLERLNPNTSSSFGELSLVIEYVYKNSIRAKSYCEIFFLSKEKFIKISDTHCTEKEIATMRKQAEKIKKQGKKADKFFGGNEINVGVGGKGWAKHFHPGSTFRRLWQMVISFGVIYSLIFVSTEFMYFYAPFSGSVGDILQYSVNYFFDVLFLLDITFKYRYFAFEEEGMIVTHEDRIAEVYREGTFFVDCFASLPFDVFAFAFGNIKVLAFLRLNKLARGVHMAEIFTSVEHGIQMLIKAELSNAVRRLIRLFLVVIALVHTFACVWVFIAEFTRSNVAANTEIYQDWLTRDLSNPSTNIDPLNPSSGYVRALYFVFVGITTVGYGDIVPKNLLETTFATFLILVGGLGYPAVIGAIASLMSNLNAKQSEYNRKMRTLGRYMDHKHIPLDIRKRIVRYYDYLWSRQRGVDEDVIFQSLPGPLRMEVASFINGHVIENIPFFECCISDLKRSLLSVLKPVVFLPNDYIVRAGELGLEMYLLERGAVRVTSADGGMTFAVLTQGDYFGEACLLKAAKRMAAVRAIGYCDCFVLTRQAFDGVLSSFPGEYDKLVNELNSTLEKKKIQNAMVQTNFKDHPKLAQTTSFHEDVLTELSPMAFQHPDSPLKALWSFLIMFIVCYNAIMIPFRLAFPTDLYTFIPDFVMDLFLAADVLLMHSFFAFVQEGRLITDRDEIVEHYLSRGGAYLEMISCVPYELFALVGIAANLNAVQMSLLLALLRLPKVARLRSYGELFLKLSKRVDSTGYFPESFMRLLGLFANVVAVVHVCACVFFLIARFNRGSHLFSSDPYQTCGDTLLEELTDPEGYFYRVVVAEAEAKAHNATSRVYGLSNFTSEDFILRHRNLTDNCPNPVLYPRTCGLVEPAICMWKDTWMQLQIEWGLIPGAGAPLGTLYLRALNWALPTLLVVVIGDVVPTTLVGTAWCTICILTGITVSASVIGSIANLVANLEGPRAIFTQKLDDLERYMYVVCPPKHLQDRARRYYEYLWGVHRGIDEKSILEDLPSTLHAEVSNVLKLSFIDSSPFFEFCNPALRKALALSLKSEIYSPGDVVIREGEYGRRMYFIESGVLEVFHEQIDGSPSLESRSSPEQSSFNVKPAASPKGRRRKSSILSKRFNYSKKPSEISSVIRRGRRGSRQTKVTILTTLYEGSYFGEGSLFFKTRRNASIRAKDYCELFVLHRDHLKMLLKRYPTERERMMKVVKELGRTYERVNKNTRKNFEQVQDQSSKLYKLIFDPKGGGRGDLPGLRGQRQASCFGIALDFASMFDPRSPFRLVWDAICFIFTLYFFFNLSYRVAFTSPYAYASGRSIVDWTLYIDYVVDVFFMFDMLMRIFFFAIMVDGKVIRERDKVWELYRAWGFPIDLIACLPVDLFALVMPVAARAETLALLRLVHWVRFLRIPQYLEALEEQLQSGNFRVGNGALQVVRMIAILIMFNHTYACTWFIIHRYVERHLGFTWAIVDGLATFDAVLGKHNIMNANIPPLHCYIRSFYFTITTLSTVGYGDIRPYTDLETVHELLVVTTGACVFAGIIGSFAAAISINDRSGKAAFAGYIEKIKRYIDYRKLPDDVKVSIVNYYTSLWERKQSTVMHEVLKELPIPLRMQLARFVYRRVIDQSRYLSSCKIEVQAAIALALRPQECVAGETIYRAGDIGRDVYFIFEGKVKIKMPSKKGQSRTTTLGPSYAFGAETLTSISGIRRTTATASTYCDLYLLSKSALEALCIEHPEEKSGGLWKTLSLVRHDDGKKSFAERQAFQRSMMNLVIPRQDSSLSVSTGLRSALGEDGSVFGEEEPKRRNSFPNLFRTVSSVEIKDAGRKRRRNSVDATAMRRMQPSTPVTAIEFSLTGGDGSGGAEEKRA